MILSDHSPISGRLNNATTSPLRSWSSNWDDGLVDEFAPVESAVVDPPTLTLFCGLPGAGKTTLAQRLEAEGRGVRVCTDDWQSKLGVDHSDTVFHERLQSVLYGHALMLLKAGISVILEDGLWRAEERAEKFHDARASGARIDLHVFDVPYDVLWTRLQHRTKVANDGACPITKNEFQRAWDLFQRPSESELAEVDSHILHVGGTG